MMPSDDPAACDRATTTGVGVGELAGDRLRGSPYLALRDIACVVHEGAVTLRGCVPTYYLKQLAQETIMPVRGSLMLVNEVLVAKEA